MISLLVFDADDTLYPWLDFFVPSFFAMAEEVSRLTGIPMATLTKEYQAVHRACGNVEYPYATLSLPSVSAWGQTQSLPLKSALAPAFQQFEDMRQKTLYLFPHVKATLDTIRAAHIPMVVCSDSAPENAMHRLRQLGIDTYFDRFYMRKRTYHTAPYAENVVLIEEMKPSPKNLLLICEEMGVKPEHTLMVGDRMEKDVYMAHLAGTKSALCQYSRRENSVYYGKLVEITSWTEEDFAQDRRQKETIRQTNLAPTYTLSSFSGLIDLLKEENGMALFETK